MGPQTGALEQHEFIAEPGKGHGVEKDDRAHGDEVGLSLY